MAHASQSTLFRQRLQSVLDRLAARVTRKSVAVLPQTVQDHMRRNQSKLSLCCHDLSEEQQAELIAVFNEDWNVPRDSDSSLVHWCPPGCCPDERKTKLRAREILEASMGSLFECPLLYRWKYFEPALAYCLRNLSLHGLLAHIWSACMTDSNDDQLLQEVLDIDNPDLPPSLKQQVRMGKVLRMLTQPGIVVPSFDVRSFKG